MKTLILLLFPAMLFAQDCKTEIDKFTKVKKVTTKSIRLYGYMMSSGHVVGKIIEEDRFLILSIVSPQHYYIATDQKFMLMVNDSVVTLRAVKHSEEKYLSGSSWLIRAPFFIDQDAIDYFIKNQVSDIRFYTSKGYVERPVKRKDAIKFQDILKCIR